MTVPDKHGRDYIPGLSHHPVTLSATEMALRAVHFEEGIMLARDGRAPPAWERLARKDIFRIGDAPDSTRSVDIAIRFREFMVATSNTATTHNTKITRSCCVGTWRIPVRRSPRRFQRGKASTTSNHSRWCQTEGSERS